MAEPIQRRGAWWQEAPDGSWLRWNDQNEAWETKPKPPPPPDGHFSGAVPPPQSVSTTVLPAASRWVFANGEVPAEWWQRALAVLIDSGVLVGVFLIALLGSALITSVAPDAGVLGALFIIAAYLFGPVYFVHHHGVHGQTVGKAAMGIYVCDEQTGEVIGYGRAFLRWLLPVIMTAALYVPGLLNVLWPLWDSKKQALHDKAVHTAVVAGDPPRGRLFDIWKRTSSIWVPVHDRKPRWESKNFLPPSHS